MKKLMLGLGNGFAVGLALGLAVWWWRGSIALGLVAMTATVSNHVPAVMAGVVAFPSD